MGPTIMKNRGCVADAFWKRFWAAQGRHNGATVQLDWASLGAIFVPKSGKMRQGSRKGPQNQKRHLKIDVKNCIEK